MKRHKRYEINFHTRMIIVYEYGILSRETSFAKALTVQRNIIIKLLASLEREGFRRFDLTANGSLVFEGWAA